MMCQRFRASEGIAILERENILAKKMDSGEAVSDGKWIQMHKYM